MRKLQGTVTSDKMQKTIVVRVDRLKKYRKYQKYFKTSKKFKAHVNVGQYKTGDVVMIQEIRPMSKEKRWEAVKLVKRSAIINPEDAES